MDECSLIFIFNSRDFFKADVLLIKKNRPEWQKGTYNGIGGHREDNESLETCALREIKEECGLEIGINDIRYVLDFIDRKHLHKVRVFNVFLIAEKFSKYRTLTDEKVDVISCRVLKSYNVQFNLHWLIPLCFEDFERPVKIF